MVAARVLGVMVLAVASAVLTAADAAACTCHQRTFAEFVEDTQWGFVGTLVTAERASPNYEFEVETWVHDPDRGSFVPLVGALHESSSCGLEVRLGERVAVFGDEEDGRLVASSYCPTLPAAVALANADPPVPQSGLAELAVVGDFAEGSVAYFSRDGTFLDYGWNGSEFDLPPSTPAADSTVGNQIVVGSTLVEWTRDTVSLDGRGRGLVTIRTEAPFSYRDLAGSPDGSHFVALETAWEQQRSRLSVTPIELVRPIAVLDLPGSAEAVSWVDDRHVVVLGYVDDDSWVHLVDTRDTQLLETIRPGFHVDSAVMFDGALWSLFRGSLVRTELDGSREEVAALPIDIRQGLFVLAEPFEIVVEAPAVSTSVAPTSVVTRPTTLESTPASVESAGGAGPEAADRRGAALWPWVATGGVVAALAAAVVARRRTQAE